MDSNTPSSSGVSSIPELTLFTLRVQEGEMVGGEMQPIGMCPALHLWDYVPEGVPWS